MNAIEKMLNPFDCELVHYDKAALKKATIRIYEHFYAMVTEHRVIFKEDEHYNYDKATGAIKFQGDMLDIIIKEKEKKQ